MRAITKSFIEQQVSNLNQLTKRESKLSWAYGGVSLVEIVNDAGGQRDVLASGHITKRELSSLIFAYEAGIRDNINNNIALNKIQGGKKND